MLHKEIKKENALLMLLSSALQSAYLTHLSGLLTALYHLKECFYYRSAIGLSK
jgi:hypothetical protein